MLLLITVYDSVSLLDLMLSLAALDSHVFLLQRLVKMS